MRAAAPAPSPAVHAAATEKPKLAPAKLRDGYESGFTRSDNRVSATTWPADVKLFTKTIESYCFGDAAACYMTDAVAMRLTSFSLYRLRRARKGAEVVGEVAFKLGDGRGQATEYTLMRKVEFVRRQRRERVLKADTFRVKTRHLYPAKGYQNTPPSKEGVGEALTKVEGESASLSSPRRNLMKSGARRVAADPVLLAACRAATPARVDTLTKMERSVVNIALGGGWLTADQMPVFEAACEDLRNPVRKSPGHDLPGADDAWRAAHAAKWERRQEQERQEERERESLTPERRAEQAALLKAANVERERVERERAEQAALLKAANIERARAERAAFLKATAYLEEDL